MNTFNASAGSLMGSMKKEKANRENVKIAMKMKIATNAKGINPPSFFKKVCRPKKMREADIIK